MTALIDGVLVTGTPEEIAEVIRQRNAVDVYRSSGAGSTPWPAEVVQVNGIPCTCGTTAVCRLHPFAPLRTFVVG